MGSPRAWSAAAKVLTLALVLLTIAIGLCSAGGGFDTHVTQAQVAMSYWGAALALAAFVTLLVGASRMGKKQTGRKR